MTTALQDARTRAARVVTPETVARLTRGVGGTGRTAGFSPLTGEPLADLPEADADEVAAAFERARAAQEAWAGRSVRERAGVLLRFHELLLRRQDEVLDLIQLETGKARPHAHEEVQGTLVVARHYGRAAPDYLRPRRHLGAIPVLTRVRERRRPCGVVGLITPWNYPLALTASDALPALVAGNTLVAKPDTQSALSALWARALLVEAGLPEEAWQVVLGEGPVVGPLVVRHADYVVFTGSTRTGRQVALGAAARLAGASLELGGKNAMIVREDADLEKAAAGAVRACFSSSGQLCLSIERLYVHERVADEFVDRFARRTRAMRLGAPLDYGTDMGSLTSPTRLAEVARHVEDAVAHGAEVVVGGRPRPDLGPCFYEPTILEGVRPPMLVCEEETFGPVVSVYRFADDAEAVRLANATRYGLSASIWSADVRRARAIAAELRVGAVNINEGYAAVYGSVRAPLGGTGDSGIGRRHGEEGILRFTEAQTVAEQRLLPLAPSFGLDDRGYAAVMSRTLRALNALRLR